MTRAACRLRMCPMAPASAADVAGWRRTLCFLHDFYARGGALAILRVTAMAGALIKAEILRLAII